MGTGIRAEVRVDSPADCPIAGVSAETGEPTHSVTRTVSGDDGQVAEEFMVEADADCDRSGMDEVVSYGDQRVYRFERDRDRGCACECVESFGCPLVDVRARDGTLHLVFHAADMEELRDVVDELQERYARIDIQRLLHDPDGDGESDMVFVDRGSLTERQREALETAHRMGYFDHPKGANAGEVAEELGVSRSTFTEHLAAAQRKLLSAVVGPDDT